MNLNISDARAGIRGRRGPSATTQPPSIHPSDGNGAVKDGSCPALPYHLPLDRCVVRYYRNELVLNMLWDTVGWWGGGWGVFVYLREQTERPITTDDFLPASAPVETNKKPALILIRESVGGAASENWRCDRCIELLPRPIDGSLPGALPYPRHGGPVSCPRFHPIRWPHLHKCDMNRDASAMAAGAQPTANRSGMNPFREPGSFAYGLDLNWSFSSDCPFFCFGLD